MNVSSKARPRLPGELLRQRIFLAVAALSLIAVLWVAYELGQIRAGHNGFKAREREQALEAQLDQTRDQNEALRQQIALLETSRKVDDEAYRQVEQKLSTLQNEILSQREELAFYRGIVADQETGLRIQGLELLSTDQGRTYILRLVLAQAMRATQRISGAVDLRVEGSVDGQPRTLDLAGLGIEGEERRALTVFSFRYFQNLEASFELPEGFLPERLIVILKPKGRRAEVLEKAFDWDVRPG